MRALMPKDYASHSLIRASTAIDNVLAEAQGNTENPWAS